MGWIYKSQDPSVISSHLYPNCWMCFVVELEVFLRCWFWRDSQGLQTRRICVDVELLWLLDWLCVWSVDIDISYWSWTNFIVDLNNKCWCWRQFDLLYFAPLWLPYHITFSWTWPLFFFHRIQQVLHIHSMFWKVTTSPLCGSTTLMERSRMLF